MSATVVVRGDAVSKTVKEVESLLIQFIKEEAEHTKGGKISIEKRKSTTGPTGITCVGEVRELELVLDKAIERLITVVGKDFLIRKCWFQGGYSTKSGDWGCYNIGIAPKPKIEQI